jgi:two-component system cell cycle response regulator
VTQAARRILVVDDNPSNTKLVSFLLSARGWEVRTAADATETVEVLAAFRPSVILMDIQLPVVDGLQLTRQLKADAATRDILIVAATAYAMKGDEQRALDAGCDAYVTKPINTRTLPEQLAALLEAKEAGGAA